jgi:uncharacterized Zn-finger protein
MENRKEFNFYSQMDNAKKSVAKILEDRFEKMTKCLDTLNQATVPVVTLKEVKISNVSTKILKKHVNRLKTKFKSQKIPFKCQLISKSANKALSFKMVLARRKFSKYESLKQRINKTLYYFKGFKRFKCQKCAKIFKFESNLNRHLCVHSIKTKRSSHFEINSKNHLPKKKYKCDVCEREFFWPSYLIIHKRIHTNEKPFACDFCEKKCALLSNLKIHMRVHTGERPYSCDKCGIKFKQRTSLINHLSKYYKN